MPVNGTDNIRVLSFLAGKLEKSFQRQIQDIQQIDYHKVNGLVEFSGATLSDKSFWSAWPIDKTDVVLLPLTSSDLEILQSRLMQNPPCPEAVIGFWSWLPAAIVVVLVDDSLSDAVLAAQLDFDGIVTEPFQMSNMQQLLSNAIIRSQRRYRLAQRHHKLHHVLRKVNRNRHYLRDKVDLLCRDLVQSNMELTNTLQDMRRAYTLQSDLTGEFDMRLMLHKALRLIKEQVDDSNVAVYICDSGDFDAHIVGAWYDQPSDMNELEKLFQKTIVERIQEQQHEILIPNAGTWRDICAQHRKKLAGLSILGLPIIIDNKLLGIMVLYRNVDQPLGPKEKEIVTPLLFPFGQAIEALQKITHLLV